MPWQVSYWLPAEKWLPPCWPPYSWQSVPYPSAPPEGIWPWWLYPKDQWPYDKIPWDNKVFGAFTARKVTMWPEDLKNYPPFGTMNLKTASTYHPPPSGTIKVHTRPMVWLDTTPPPYMWEKAKLEEAPRTMSRIRPIRLKTEDGSITIKNIRSAPWNQYKPKTSPKPPPKHDLFQ
jgi:hypothetical protein